MSKAILKPLPSNIRSIASLFSDKGSGYNLLLIVVDGIRLESLQQDMPALSDFAQYNIQFNHHYSSGNRKETGLFGLFYGISPTYLDSILAAREPSTFINALGTQGYQFGLFSSDGFKSALYRQALLSDFSLPAPARQSDSATTAQWQQWLNSLPNPNPWFSYVNLIGSQESQDPAEVSTPAVPQ